MRRAVAAAVVTAAIVAASGSAGRPAPSIVFAAVVSNSQYEDEPPTARYTADLVSIRSDGSFRRRLTRTVAWEDEPAWSADRRRLAFTRGTPVCHAATCDGSNDTSVWIAFASGAPARRLTRPPRGYADRAPAWSPDGRSLAFIRQYATDKGSEDGVYLVDATDRGLRKLTAGRTEARQVAWSPDGSTIAVGLVLVDVRTGATSPVSAAGARPVGGVAWSPDGRLLAFSDGSGVHVVPAAGGRSRRLATARFLRGLAWSPDGRRLVFAGRRTPLRERFGERIAPSTDLYVVGVDGRRLRRLTDTAGAEFSPSWR